MICCAFLFPTTLSLLAQSPTATVNGQVRDTTGAVVRDADVQLINDRTNIKYPTRTNNEGIYSIIGVAPGIYRIQVSRAGFKTIIQSDITLNVLDARAINFELPVGAVSEIVTVEGGASTVDTESAAVSTVVDRQFAENLPMNGRSFQTLIQLTPGVVLTTSSANSSGQFSVNGQRASSNYWMVDGVSANIGMGAGAVGLGSYGDTTAGTVGGFSAQGGTNSLVSIDAMQEFRIQTSTFAPEFGRTPGAQISIVTRSGTNQFHGTAFDYLRNDALDANDWFNGVNILNPTPLPKAEERQNDFGGTIGGRILKDSTFFFFSYEGLRLRLPQTELTTVPMLSTRQNAIAAMQPVLDAYPLPAPTAPNLGDGSAQLDASYSNRSTLDAYSIRIDHRLKDNLTLFGRYNYSPSELVQRPLGYSLSVVQTSQISTQTATIGATWIVSPTVTNDIRANYSRNAANGNYALDDFDGAVPIPESDLGFPSAYNLQNSASTFGILSLTSPFLFTGKVTENTQHQFNLVESLSLQRGSHSLKFGADYRRLTPLIANYAYNQTNYFLDLASAQAGQILFTYIVSSSRVPLVLQNLSFFAQDTWRAKPRLTLTYGIRWDVDFAPSTSSGPSLPAVVNFGDLSTLALAPPGTAAFNTRYGNFAPRIGMAYQLSQKLTWESVLRGGWGIFYDLPTAQLNILAAGYPFGADEVTFGGQFPLSAAAAAPPPVSSTSPTVYAVDPNLRSPYTQQWNLAYEQSLGGGQSFSASYVGAIGRDLLLLESLNLPNPNIEFAQLVGNYGTSDYNALQLQFQRRLKSGLQALASYTFAHSIDTGSTGSGGLNSSDYFVRSLGANVNRGPSDFDIRHHASIALTYDVPAPKASSFVGAILRDWSTQSVFQVQSAPPVDVNYQTNYVIGAATVGVRPDVTPGIPLYLYGSQYPGGKAFNNTIDPSQPNCIGPFCPPPLDPTTNEPTRQGDLGRNALRGFGAWQWDFAVHRDFRLTEGVKLQFRAELFNVLNHPNFGPPSGNLTSPTSFGLSNQTLAGSLNVGSNGNGGFSSLYQLGGPRSAQFALKLTF